MDPVTAALLLGTAISAYMTYEQAQAERNRLAAQQKREQTLQTKREIGAAQQATNTALTSAANRNKSQATPSFSQASSFLGSNLPSLQQANINTSGTF